MKTLKKHYKKILGIIVLLVFGIQVFRYVFPPFETAPSTVQVHEDTGIELKVKRSLGIDKLVIHHGTHDEVLRYWGKYEYTLINNTSQEWGYGGSYRLQVKRGANWEDVKPKEEVGFTLEMRNLPANSSVSDKLSINFIYGKLPAGKYRIVKDVYYGGGQPSYNVAGNFRVWF